MHIFIRFVERPMKSTLIIVVVLCLLMFGISGLQVMKVKCQTLSNGSRSCRTVSGTYSTIWLPPCGSRTPWCSTTTSCSCQASTPGPWFWSVSWRTRSRLPLLVCCPTTSTSIALIDTAVERPGTCSVSKSRGAGGLNWSGLTAAVVFSSRCVLSIATTAIDTSTFAVTAVQPVLFLLSKCQKWIFHGTKMQNFAN